MITAKIIRNYLETADTYGCRYGQWIARRQYFKELCEMALPTAEVIEAEEKQRRIAAKATTNR